MRIGLVSGEFPPMQGGVGSYTLRLAEQLQLNGHDVHVVTSKAAGGAEYRSESRGRSGASREFGTLHAVISNWGWRANRQIADLVKRNEIDLVNIQYQAAAFNMRSAAINFLPWRLKGLVPTVVTYHDLLQPYLFPKAGRLREEAVSFMARHASGVVATNQGDLDHLRAWGIPAPRSTAIPIGSNIQVSGDDISAAAVRSSLGLVEGDILLGHFGFVNEPKGTDVLPAVLQQLNANVHLMLIGGKSPAHASAVDKAYQVNLERMVTDLDLESRVHWSGYLDDAQVSAHLLAVDIMIHPYRDGVSLRRGTLMAALVHGRPIISTAPQEVVDQLRHGENIYLVGRPDSDLIASAVVELTREHDLLARIALGARKAAAEFSWTSIGTSSSEFFDEMLRI